MPKIVHIAFAVFGKRSATIVVVIIIVIINMNFQVFQLGTVMQNA